MTTTTGDPTTTVATTAVGNAATTLPTLLNVCYYHGLLPREDVQFFLKNNGDFLVRISQLHTGDTERQIIISLMVEKDAGDLGLKHFVIRKQKGKYQ
uniref:SH2 domain-containing protein n=1 Tax=Panagrolaimus sp. PS1159 TaxID=55785 RepID=A0AC35FDI4_9BILA